MAPCQHRRVTNHPTPVFSQGLLILPRDHPRRSLCPSLSLFRMRCKSQISSYFGYWRLLSPANTKLGSPVWKSNGGWFFCLQTTRTFSSSVSGPVSRRSLSWLLSCRPSAQGSCSVHTKVTNQQSIVLLGLTALGFECQ